MTKVNHIIHDVEGAEKRQEHGRQWPMGDMLVLVQEVKHLRRKLAAKRHPFTVDDVLMSE